MPRQGKSRRVAARQAELGQRKRRQTRGPSGVPQSAPDPRPTGTQDNGEGSGPLTEAVRPEAAAPSPSSRTQATRTQAAATQPRPAFSSRRTDPRPAAYLYVASELRRVGILAAGILAILIILTLVLR
jgi:hypothetical protein